MAERTTKPELIDDAEDLGIDPSGKTKAELADAIDARNPDELGPVIPEGQTTPDLPKPSGPPTKGVQPRTADDIPEAGR